MCVHIHTREHYAAIKKNEITLSAATRMHLENIMLGNIRQRRANTGRHHLYVGSNRDDTNGLIYIHRFTDTENKFRVTKGEMSGRQLN